MLNYRRPSGIDKEFFVQLFVEPDKDEPATNTQRLLSKMFQEQNINFVEVCSRIHSSLVAKFTANVYRLVSYKVVIANASIWQKV